MSARLDIFFKIGNIMAILLPPPPDLLPPWGGGKTERAPPAMGRNKI